MWTYRPNIQYALNILLAIAIALNTVLPSVVPTLPRIGAITDTNANAGGDQATLWNEDATTILSMQAPDTPLALNELFDVTVHIAGLDTPLRAFQFDAVYDSTKVALVDITMSDYLSTPMLAAICPQATQVALNSVRLACVRDGSVAGVQEDGLLVTLQFVALMPGSTDFSLTNVQLADESVPPVAIAADVVADSITIEAAPAINMTGNTAIAGLPSDTVSHTFTLTNTGDFTDTFTLTISDNDWTTIAPTTVGPLGINSAETFNVDVTIPTNPARDDVTIATDSFTLTAVSGLNDAITAQRQGTTAANITPDVTLPNDIAGSGVAEMSVTYLLTVTNTGNYVDTFTLAVGASDWSADLSTPTTPALEPNESYVVELTIDVPSVAAGTQDSVMVTATSMWDAGVTDVIEVTTTALENTRYLYLPIIVNGESDPRQDGAQRTAVVNCYAADLDCDVDVDSADLTLITDRWNCADSDTCFDSAYDLDGNNIVNAFDLAWIANEYDIAPPELTITTPISDAIIVADQVVVNGTVTDKHTATVTVNGTAATLNGATFEATVPVALGEQELVIVAQDAIGQSSVVNRPVIITDSDLTLKPIGNQVAPLGSTLSLDLTAYYVGDELLQFNIAPQPVPDNALFNLATGDFTFSPVFNQTGTYTLTFSVTDGALSDAETITIDVSAPNPTDDTALQGRILDANDAELGIITPLVGATVTNIETGLFTTTDDDGYFTLGGLTPGENHFDYQGATATPVGTYGAYRSKKDLLANVTTVIDRPIYIMAIDTDGQTIVDPNNETIVHNPNITTTIEIPPQTVVDDNGNLYDGPISISEVPDEFTPGSLPDTLDPSMVLTIQPMGLTFNTPAPITFPNVDGLAPGSEVDIWSMDHATSQFFKAGLGRVTDDGTMIETIDGGIQESSWHFLLPLLASLFNPDDENGDGDNMCKSPIGSSVTLFDGSVETGFALPAHMALGEAEGLQFTYHSDWAFPHKVFPIHSTIVRRSAVPDTISYRASLAGVELGGEAFVDTSGLSESQDEHLRNTIYFDTSDLPTGIYRNSIRLNSNYSRATVSADTNDKLAIVNQQNSPLGSGWDISGLSRVTLSHTGELLYVNGDGTTRRFTPAPFNFFDWNEEGDPDSGNWIIAEDGLSILQTINAEPTFFVSPTDFINTTIRGTFKVATSDDDDFIGFVFGYNSPISSNGDGDSEFDFLLFDWKQRDQNTTYGFAREGFSLVRVNGTFDDPHPVFWPHTDSVEFDVIATDHGSDRGWQDNTEYDFTLEYQANRLKIYIEDELIFDEFGDFPSGRFGFYNYSQPNVQYRDFTATSETGRYIGPDGDFTTITKDILGNYVRRHPNGMVEEFNAKGLQSAMVERNGNTTSYFYDAQDRLTAIVDPAGLTTTLSYQDGYLQTVVDPVGRTTTFQHDSAGNLTAVTFPDATSQSFDYDARHLLTHETDPRGNTTVHEFDLFGRLFKVTLPDGTVRRTSNSQSVGILGVRIFSQRTATEADPAPVQRVSLSDDFGMTWLAATQHAAPLVTVEPTTNAVTRPAQAVSTYTDGEDRVTTYRPGVLGSVNEVIDPSGHATTYERDDNSNPTRTTLPSGASFSMTYNEAGEVTAFTDHTLNGTTHFERNNPFNLITAITDPFNQTTTFAYDNSGNMQQITTPLNRVVTFLHDERGLMTELTDSLGTTTAYEYDTQGNVVSMTQASRAATMTYTPAGYLATMTDPLGRAYGFAYDEFGRITQETTPDNRTIAYQYDPNGNLSSLTPPGKPAHTFGYNEIDLMTAYNAPPVTDGGTNRTDYAYNFAQQLTQVTRPDGLTLSYDYDTGGRLATVTIPRGSYQYDYSSATGQLATITGPDNGTLTYDYNGELLTGVTWDGAVSGAVNYEYDAGGRLSRLLIDSAGTPPPPRSADTTFTYDADSALIGAGELSLAYDPTSGLIAGTALATITDAWAFNPFAELSQYRASHDGNDFFAVDYERDALGRITQTVEIVNGTTTTTTYTYDLAGRLATVTENGVLLDDYSYDANGNRTDGGTGLITVYDDQDRLLQYGANTYTYTPNGELLTKSVGAATTSYDYDVIGNLLGATLPDGTKITYAIDGEDRRIARFVDGAMVQGFLYADALNPIAELDSAGNVVTTFVYASQSNVPDYMVKESVTYRIISDHLGSVRFVIDATTGDIAQQLDYGAFGEVIQDTNPRFQPFGFAGGIYDQDTGLVRFGARDYDAEIGRWTNKDPIRFEGKDANLYVYVGNNPVNHFDPSGNLLFVLGALAIGLYPFAVAVWNAHCEAKKNLDMRSSIQNVGPVGGQGAIVTATVLWNPLIGSVAGSWLLAYQAWNDPGSLVPKTGCSC